MRTFAHRKTQPRQQAPPQSALARKPLREPRSQTSATMFAHDFTRIPMHPESAPASGVKLVWGSSDDSLEREADDVAERVMRVEQQASFERKEVRTDRPGGAGAPMFVHEALSWAGEPLDTDTRAFMEPRFGYDFSRVRVHTDAKATESARAMDALAYTAGHDVVFGTPRYVAGTHSSRQLLAHELTHVVQQQRPGNARMVQCKRHPPDPEPPDSVPNDDPETLLGERLVAEFPNGVAVAIFAEENDAAKTAAMQWAAREIAIGTKGRTLKAKDLIFGQPMSESVGPLDEIVSTIGRVIASAVAKAFGPAGVPPGAGIGPASIRTLALFSHGLPDWLGIGKHHLFRAEMIPPFIKKIAPNLSPNVNVILYACNAARGTRKPEDQWQTNTMTGGGSDSFAALMRDALIDEGKQSSTVWGHTESGDPGGNPSLREFTAAAGKDAPGISYASTYIYTDADRNAALRDLIERVVLGKHRDLGDRDRFIRAANAQIVKHMYHSYREANMKTKFRGYLAQIAPVRPYEVAEKCKDYWNTYWPSVKNDVAGDLIASLRLKTPPSGRYRDQQTVDD